jgi:peptide/nickel transport system permease protein
MRTYVIRRLMLVIPTLALVTLGVFLNVRFIPGSVIDMMIADNLQGGVTAGVDVQAMKVIIAERLGLDQPVHIQYLRWLGALPQKDGGYHGVLQGDLGHSLWE